MLTDRELEVLDHVYHGRSSKKIADELNLSSRTVELHRQNCSKKIGIITPHILSMLFSSKVPGAYLWARTVMLKENKNETVATT
jgi:orotate phosphoribosyltransferase-like protein